MNLSEFGEFVEELDLGDEQPPAVNEGLHGRGLEVRDDCGRAGVESTAYVNEELAETTTDAMQLFLREVRRHPVLTRDEEVEFAKRIERGDLWAKEKVVNSNLRLAVSIAKKYQGLDLPLLDLIQEGILETPFGTLLPSEERGPEDEVDIGLREDVVRSALCRLPDREREVIQLRYGNDGDEPVSLREAGRRLGVSSEGVRKLERQPLADLAESCDMEALAPAA